MNADRGVPAVVEGEVIFSRTELMHNEWAELRDDLRPTGRHRQPAQPRVRRVPRWLVGWLLLIVAALLCSPYFHGIDEPMTTPVAIKFAPVDPAQVAQLQTDIHDAQPEPSTDGLVPIDDTDVSARCWGDLREAGFTGRQWDDSEHVMFVDPDALIHWCDQTESDAEFAETFDDETNGSGTWGPTADLDGTDR